jgi:sugar phosphate permease
VGIVKSASIGRSEPQGLPRYAQLPALTVAGGVAFWAANFATSLLPIAAEYRAALSIAYLPMVLVESLVAGLVVGLVVSFLLLRFSDKLPTVSPMLKATLLSAVALLVLTIATWAAASLAEPSDASRYFVVGTLLNIPRFLALGIAVGYVHKRSATVRRPTEGPG